MEEAGQVGGDEISQYACLAGTSMPALRAGLPLEPATEAGLVRGSHAADVESTGGSGGSGGSGAFPTPRVRPLLALCICVYLRLSASICSVSAGSVGPVHRKSLEQ